MGAAVRLAVLVAALVVVPAASATFTFSVVTSSPVTAPGITLSGDDQSKTFTIVTRIAYTNINFSGWNVSASATTPTSGTHTLPPFDVTAGTYSCVTGCTSNPNSAVTYPITLSTTAQEIYNAATFTGRGTFNITNTYEVTYPASAISGTYTSTVTLSGSTGP